MERLTGERRRVSTFDNIYDEGRYQVSTFAICPQKGRLDRFVDKAPFVPGNRAEREKRCEEILSIQSMGLKKRMEHTSCRSAVIGISGGLDSTLALL